MSIKVDGFEDSMKEMAKLEHRSREAFARGLVKAGLTLQAASQRLVPVDTGALRSSAYTTLNGVPTQGDEGAGAIARAIGAVKSYFKKALSVVGVSKSSPDMSVEVGYTQSYAIYVHENLNSNHPNGGQAKYLEQPAREIYPQLLSIVRNEVENANS